MAYLGVDLEGYFKVYVEILAESRRLHQLIIAQLKALLGQVISSESWTVDTILAPVAGRDWLSPLIPQRMMSDAADWIVKLRPWRRALRTILSSFDLTLGRRLLRPKMDVI